MLSGLHKDRCHSISGTDCLHQKRLSLSSHIDCRLGRGHPSLGHMLAVCQCEQGLSKLMFRTVKRENIMYLSLHHNHFSFIKDLQKFSSSYCCAKCKKIFTRHWNLKQHVSSYDATTRKIYGSGIYRVQSLFLVS